MSGAERKAGHSASSYRERYLACLDEQERQEKQHAIQLELLKKTLFRLGIAAGGMDEVLDNSMSKLRDVMRGGSGAQTAKQLERVTKAAENFTHERTQEISKTASSMAALLEQYQSLQLPSDVKSSLRQFSTSLNDRLSTHRQYSSVLQELAQLQQEVLSAATNPQASLWSRIKGGNTLNTEAEVDIADAQADPPISHDSKLLGDAELDAELQDSERAKFDGVNASKQNTSALAGADGHVSDDQELIPRIVSTLRSLIENVEPTDAIVAKIDAVTHRLDTDLGWSEIAEALDDIRDILFLRYLKVDNEFTGYLNQVRGELTDIRNQLAGVIEVDADSTEAARLFSESVEQGVSDLRDTVNSGNDMEQLKRDVDAHISEISEALAAFKSRSEASIADQLNQLVNRMKAIEKESEETKKALQEERHKATHDTLTGLPNREAYLERSQKEYRRFKKDQHALTLAICDIDFFKKINDGFGHQVGDKVLQLIAKVVSGKLRKVDFIARFGGEEFVLLLPEASAEDALSVLDRIRTAVAETPLRFKQKPLQITVSFGIASFNQGEDFDSVFARADAALYDAKNQGRNRCVIAS